jgi:hypothetical protein
LKEPEFWNGARNIMESVHAVDKEVIFQGCLFETVSPDANQASSWQRS